MNTIISWLESPVAERLGWVLVHSLWQLALLAGIYPSLRLGQMTIATFIYKPQKEEEEE